MDKFWWVFIVPAVPVALEYLLRFYYKCLPDNRFYVWPPNTYSIAERGANLHRIIDLTQSASKRLLFRRSPRSGKPE